MRFHDVQMIDFEGTKMVLKVDGQVYRVDLPSISSRLANAKDDARRSYSISPSGYGVHWPDIDEDLTIDGLIASAQPSQPKTSEKSLLLKEQPPKQFTKSVSKARLEALETEVKEELEEMAKSEGSIHDPITDGVVDIDRYLSSSPKVLWILKEPWEPLKEREGGGGWSVTQQLIPELIAKNEIEGICTYRRMLYVTYSIFNGYKKYDDIPYAREDSSVGDSFKKIAYININKFPGKTSSVAANIESYYRRNRNILMKQIEIINPDVVIGGNILHLFYEDLSIKVDQLKSEGSVDFCSKAGRLYINAYHPGYWRFNEKKYVEGIVTVIRTNCQSSELH